MIIAAISDLILPNLLLYRPPGDNLKATVDKSTVSNTFSNTLTVLLRLAPAVISYPSSAVKFSLFKFLGASFNYGVALRARKLLNPKDKTVEQSVFLVRRRRL